MAKRLNQVIVGTKGQLVTVSQDRDELGRFIPGAFVNRQCALGFAEMYMDTEIARNSGASRVFVQHAYHKDTGVYQMVTTVRPGAGATVKTFLNDGDKISPNAKKNKVFHSVVVTG